MRLIIKKNYEECSKWVGDYIASKIIDFNPSNNKQYVLGLPTGSTPLGVYKRLIELNKKGTISFKNVVTFNMDEYVGLNAEHPQSYHYFMKHNFFDFIDIDKNNVHILNGIAPDLIKECNSYEDEIKNKGGINLFLGGTGNDGHIAFNEPGSSLSSKTRIKTLTEDTRIVNSRFFNGIDEVPKTALTVGIKTITDSKEVVIMMSGAAKGIALAHAIEEPISQMWPVSILQMHEKAIIVCDESAIGELKVKTVNYFKDIEKNIKEPLA